MGCDIHICIQVQQDGIWEEIPYATVYEYEGAKAAREGIRRCPQGFHARNYDLFGILANVRNGSGFAGITTGEGWPSIAPDRGFPEGFKEDAVQPDQQYPEDGARYMGDHSFTWIALEELKAFDWDNTKTTLYGVVDATQYEEMLTKKSFAPLRDYCGAVSGPGIQTYSPMNYTIAKSTHTLVPEPYVRIAWEESAREATYDWPGTVIPWLEQLAAGRPLRLILGFDS